MEQSAVRLIFEQSSGAGNIKMVLEPGRLEEYDGRTDELEIRLSTYWQRPNRKADLAFGTNIDCSRMQNSRSAPDDDRSECDRDDHASRDRCSNRRDR